MDFSKILTSAQQEFVLALSSEIKRQDNLATANPYLYLLTQRREEIRPDTHADDYVLYLDFETKIYSKDELLEYLKDDYSNLSYWVRDNLYELRDFLDLTDIEGTHALLDYESIKKNYSDMEVFYFEERQEASKNDLNVFFTRKAYDKHIDANKHHYDTPEPYIKHAFRNPELEGVLDVVHTLAHHLLLEPPKKCYWDYQDNDEAYRTGCEHMFMTLDGDTIEHHGFNNCPFCGGKIEVKS